MSDTVSNFVREPDFLLMEFGGEYEDKCIKACLKYGFDILMVSPEDYKKINEAAVYRGIDVVKINVIRRSYAYKKDNLFWKEDIIQNP